MDKRLLFQALEAGNIESSIRRHIEARMTDEEREQLEIDQKEESAKADANTHNEIMALALALKHPNG